MTALAQHLENYLTIRRALGWDPEVESTIYYEQYDNEPVLRVTDPDELARLKKLVPG